MKSREKKIQNYFNMWLTKSTTGIDAIFDDNIIYSECYGPEYNGIEQVKRWFSDWCSHGTVLEWHIKQFINQDKKTVVEWYFKCNYDGVINGFDGVSLIEFNNNEKIYSIREFQSKAEHYFPYSTM
ncbi:MAG: nuclear transport factor 2 family protein [Herbinix sp.]|jgi:hypothetical protein|nr:nuclear transport factor 2 family protein [Herbinix sp.]